MEAKKSTKHGLDFEGKHPLSTPLLLVRSVLSTSSGNVRKSSKRRFQFRFENELLVREGEGEVSQSQFVEVSETQAKTRERPSEGQGLVGDCHELTHLPW